MAGEIRKVTWDEVMRWSKLLANALLQDKKIWGIPRGGQLVATIMAFHGCELVQQRFHADVIIDDIACTGNTLQALKNANLPQELAVLVKRYTSCCVPDYYSYSIATAQYMLFPWESETEARKLIERGRFTDQELDTRLGRKVENVQSETQSNGNDDSNSG